MISTSTTVSSTTVKCTVDDTSCGLMMVMTGIVCTFVVVVGLAVHGVVEQRRCAAATTERQMGVMVTGNESDMMMIMMRNYEIDWMMIKRWRKCG